MINYWEYTKLNKQVSEYLDKYKIYDEVESIVLTGSYGRGNHDKFSDIDYVIVLNEDNCLINEGKESIENFILDCRVIYMNQLEDIKWSQNMYFAYLNCSIFYDKNNFIRSIIEKKKKEWEEYSILLLSQKLVELSVIFKFKDNWRNLYNSDTHYEKSLKRKDYISANYILNIGIDLILEILYLSNKQHIPDKKNLFRLLHDSNVEPKGSVEIISGVLGINDLSIFTLENKYRILEEIINEIKLVIDKSLNLSSDLKLVYYDNRGAL